MAVIPASSSEGRTRFRQLTILVKSLANARLGMAISTTATAVTAVRPAPGSASSRTAPRFGLVASVLFAGCQFSTSTPYCAYSQRKAW